MTTILLLVAGAIAAALFAAHLVAGVKEILAAWRRRIIIAAWLTPPAAISFAVVIDATVLWLAAAVLAVALVVVWLRRGRTKALVDRWAARSRRTSGVATTLDIARVASGWAMRRQARVLRPSLAELPRRELRKVPTTQYAVRLAQVGQQTVWASVRDVVTIFGGPGTGKTAMLGGILIDAPGAAFVTSTRLDLLDAARGLREKVGPIRFFNPGGLGALPSDVGFDVLIDCENPVDATERAIDMIPMAKGRGGEAERWDAQGRRVLAALLHAAALGETLDGRPRTMDHVLGWVSDPDAAKTEVTRLLRKSTQAAFVPAALQFVTTNDRTRSSVTSTIMPALQWLLSPSAVAATRPRDGAPRLDVAQLLRERATVYVLGRDEANTSALLAAFNGYVMRASRRLAGGKRLDPPPFLILDEAGRVAPVPLDDWSGDAGGSGIVIVSAFQSRADVVDRWGPSGASKILNNSGAAVLLGGTKDNDDLEQWSRLAGNRDEVVKTYDSKGRLGSRSVRQVPVLPTSQLAALPKGHAVVFRTGMRPVIGRTQRVWERADVRAAKQRARFEQTLDAAWQSTWVVDSAGVVVDAAEKFVRAGAASPAERATYARPAADPRPAESGALANGSGAGR